MIAQEARHMPEIETPETLEDALSRIQYLTGELSKVREEAAKARVAKRQAVETTKAETEATLKAEYDAKVADAEKTKNDLTVEVGNSKVQIAKLTAALNAVVPDAKERVTAVASRLIGSTEEELAADADRVKQIFGLEPAPARTPATDPSQGAGGNQDVVPLNGDKLTGLMTNILNKRH